MNVLRKAAVATTLAGVALAGPVAMALPASADVGLVNVDVTNLLNHDQVVLLQNVSIPVAAAVCGVSASVLSAELANASSAACPVLTTVTQLASVQKS
jgi:hypothetical protein